MIKINLLPFRAARKKENIKQHISIYVLSIFLVVLGLIWYHIHLTNKVNDLVEKIETGKTKLAALKRKTKEIDRINKLIAELKKKLEVIERLQADKKDPLVLMDAFTQTVVPRRMWLTGLSVKAVEIKAQPKKKGKKKGKNDKNAQMVLPSTVGISGTALDNKTIADFMKNLEKDGMFVEVKLEALQQVERRGIKLKQFSISCYKLPYNMYSARKVGKR